MITRGLDLDHDWIFGRGRNAYRVDVNAVQQSIRTRLLSHLGDCFFDLGAGVDWFHLLGGKSKLAIELAVSSVILNTENVTGLVNLTISWSPSTRAMSLVYRCKTAYGDAYDSIDYEVGA